jgi:phosphatidylglycerol:prolipoprotein diacylglycerol transferase
MHPALHDRTILFRVGPVIVASYAIPVGLSFFAGFSIAMWYAESAGLPAASIAPLFLLGILPAALLGARLVSVLSDLPRLVRDPVRALVHPGFFVHGGLLGGGAAIVCWCLVTGDSLLVLLDAAGLSLPVAEAICRLGCFVYGCCWGRPTSCRLGVAYRSHHAKVVRCHPHLRNVPLHPTPLYTAAAMSLVFALLYPYSRVAAWHGSIIAAYLVLHGAVRVAIERWRDDDRGRIGARITQTQLYAVVGVAIGLGLLVWAWAAAQPVRLDTRVRYLAVAFDPDVWPYLLGCSALSALVFGLHNGELGRWLWHRAPTERRS